MGIWGLLWSQCSGIGQHFKLILATQNYFTFLRWHQCPSRLGSVFLVTLWSSFKQIKVPYVFEWEHGITLHSVSENRSSSHGEGEVSWIFSSWGRKLRYILELWQEWPFKTHVCSATSGLLSIYDGHLRNLNYAWQDNMDASGGEAGARVSLYIWHSDIGTPIHFQEESDILTLWSIEFRMPLEDSKGCDVPCPDEAETDGFL